MTENMNAIQGNTPPAWLGRHWWTQVCDVLGGWSQNREKLAQVGMMIWAMARPSCVRARLERLVELGHCEEVPTMAQLLVASRHQLSFSLAADTREFYRAQGIPWGFHNLRRFVAYPTTMMDPVGLFSPRDSIIQHILQTFHRHATYDLVLLRSHEDGLEEMQRQLDQLAEGTHRHQRSLDSLVEDGSYHDRLRVDVPEFRRNPMVAARPIPDGLSTNPMLMVAMDQFKDIRGYTRYASRLRVGWVDVVVSALQLAFNETIGDLMNVSIGPSIVTLSAVDPEIRTRHLNEKIKASLEHD